MASIENNTEVENTLNIDEKKINIAVRFLSNLNVRETKRERKVQFLKDKGLNDKEIQIALEKADELDSQLTEEEISNEWSFWDYFKGIVLGVGVLSSANYAYKAYFLPYIAHEIKDDQRIESLNESVQVLKDDLKQKTYEFTCTLKSIQSLLEDQKQLLLNIEKKLGQDELNSNSFENIKSDLTALKSIMLSKDSFPVAPFAASATVEIPAWQKVGGEEQNKEEKEIEGYTEEVDIMESNKE